MKTLNEISMGFHKKTDKSSIFHNYTKLYPLYFEPLRLEKLKILEIGVDKGYSMNAWREYFPHAEIIGIDILDLKHLEKDRTHILKGDQKDCAFLKNTSETYGPFDIIIDDGSHHNDDMKATFDCMFPLLKAGGIYVVEDLHSCYWGESHGSGKPVFMDRMKEMLDAVNASGKSDCANREQDTPEAVGRMNWWEKHVEFVHMYRSIVFIKKYATAWKDIPESWGSLPQTPFVMVGNVARPPKIQRTPPILFRIKRKTRHILAKISS